MTSTAPRFDNLAADVKFRGAGIGGGVRHDETCAPGFGERTVEELYPKIVGIVYAWHAEWESRIVFDAFSVHAIDVERWICHDEIKSAEAVVRILVVTVGLLDIAFKRMDGKVHLAEPDRFDDAFNAVNADVSGVAIFLVVANERCTLDKHTTGSAGRIKDASVKGLDNLNDEFHERGWREEFTAALPLAHGEIAEEVLINLPESVAFNVHRDLFHDAEEFEERILFKPIVSFGEDTLYL